MTFETFQLLTPEAVLIAVAVAIYLGGAFFASPRAWRVIAGTAIFGAAVVLWFQRGRTSVAEPVTLDLLAFYGRWIALGFGAMLVLLASGAVSEYVGSLLLSIVGLMLTASAGDLVLLFVSLELISIPTYILLYLGRRDEASQESAVKYFFLSILSSAILLYGFSFLYGQAGSTDLSTVRTFFHNSAAQPTSFSILSRLALVLVFAGLCFKATAVPFHFYAPDVYQGTTYPNAAMLSVVPKAAGVIAMARLVVATMPGLEPYSWHIVLIVSIATMTVGNLLALWQDDLRRLLAYSSIAQAGYLLMGLAAGLAADRSVNHWSGVGAMLFYLVTYAAATLGAFALLEYLGRPGRSLDGVEELAGLGQTRPLSAAMLAVCMFSLAGVPPLVGFWGKFSIFGSVLDIAGWAESSSNAGRWFLTLVVAGALNAAVAAAYYLRIVGVMYFRTPLATPRAEGGGGPWLAAVLCTVAVLVAGVFPGPLLQETKKAATPVCPAAWSGGTPCICSVDVCGDFAIIVGRCDSCISHRRKIDSGCKESHCDNF